MLCYLFALKVRFQSTYQAPVMVQASRGHLLLLPVSCFALTVQHLSASSPFTAQIPKSCRNIQHRVDSKRVIAKEAKS